MSIRTKKGPNSPKEASSEELDLAIETVADLEPANRGDGVRGGYSRILKDGPAAYEAC